MASYFLDTSAIIKNYVVEAGHLWVATVCDAAAGNLIYVSQAALVETVAALCRMARVRPRRFGLTTRNRLISEFRRDAVSRFVAITVDDSIYTRAADLCLIHPLRAYDAVQVACALTANEQGVAVGLAPLTFVCADVELLAVAVAEGLTVENPNNHP